MKRKRVKDRTKTRRVELSKKANKRAACIEAGSWFVLGLISVGWVYALYKLVAMISLTNMKWLVYDYQLLHQFLCWLFN